MTNHCRRLLLLCGILLAACHVAFSQSLSTPPPVGSINSGYMFEIKSLTGIDITDFSINFRLPLQSNVALVGVWVHKTEGSYLGSQFVDTNWTLVGIGGGSGAFTFTNPFALNLNASVPVYAGQTKSFYVATILGTAGSGPRLEGSTGTLVPGSTLSSNADLEIHEGHSGQTNFEVNSLGAAWAGTVHYTPHALIASDLQLSQILRPQINSIGCTTLSNSEVIAAEIRNLGTAAVPAGSLVTFTYQVDANTPIVEVAALPLTLQKGDTYLHTFGTPADLSTAGLHNIVASLSFSPDTNAINDTLLRTVESGGNRISAYPYVQDFESITIPSQTGLPGGLHNDPNDALGPKSDWYWGTSDALFAAPSAAHSGQNYVFINSQGSYGSVNLRTPCFDLTALGNANPKLSFYLYSNSLGGAAMANDLSFDVISFPSGTITPNVFPNIGHLSNNWIEQTIDLSAFVGQVIQVIFRANTTVSASHNLAIDDLVLTDTALPPGQAPRPGMALFQINDARNTNGDAIPLGLAGPYFTTLSSGGTIHFQFEGEPSQPILFFSGPLNPGIATFGSIGSCDVGLAPLDPVTGVPLGIAVLADGNHSDGFNPFFNTSTLGFLDIGFTVPNLPPGILGTFQFVIPTTQGPSVALSNAIQVAIL